MAVISISGLTFGYLTLPAASAAGLPGSFLMRNAEASGLTLPSDTTRASSDRSSSEEKVGAVRRAGATRGAPAHGGSRKENVRAWRRCGPPPDVEAVESAFAIFSDSTR